ncbi:MAG: hypothetical protein ACYSTY_01150 [Planctomycetota bacterium]|jgi:hypothetical protein
MEQIVQLIDGHMYVVVFLLIGLCVVLNAIIRAITAIFTTQAVERSRREIAAYIAEGSITPEQGERLMRADAGHRRPRCA